MISLYIIIIGFYSFIFEINNIIHLKGVYSEIKMILSKISIFPIFIITGAFHWTLIFSSFLEKSNKFRIVILYLIGIIYNFIYFPFQLFVNLFLSIILISLSARNAIKKITKILNE